MTNAWTRLAVLVWCALSLLACSRALGPARAPRDVIGSAARPELSAFESEAELERFLRDLAHARQRAAARGKLAASAKLSCLPATCESLGASCGVHPDGCGGSINCGPCGGDEAKSPAAAAAPEAFAEEMPAATESITNVQHAGVDEGSIVKLSGDYLIVLRRGRLFSLSIANGALKPISSSNAFGPDVDPEGAWYDELLVNGDTVVVIGYSYARGGTEVGLFALDAKGRLAYRNTYHLRSNDYYSSRNYASRLIGKQLVFYTPLSLHVDPDDLYSSFPALRKWRRRAKDREFRRTALATDVYRPLAAADALTEHTVTSCDLGNPDLSCSSTIVLGPPGRVFYVSPESVYVWVTDHGDGSIVYRMPLDGSTPSALRASGAPVDQFSFLEGSDEQLNVLVRADASGDGMWGAEVSAGDVALLRVPVSTFSQRVRRAPASSYTPLPRPDGYSFQNRFVADYVLYGTESQRGRLFAHRFAKGRRDQVARLPLAHGVERIEALGSNAVAIGGRGKSLHFSPIALGARPWVAAGYSRAHAAQGELRSHGFFYRADSERSGLLGLPIREPGRSGYEHLFRDSASVLFVRNRGLALSELGALAAKPEDASDDRCQASCVDWYGNARPIFVGERIFALLGYELVEGELNAGRIREKRRLSFAPR